MRDDNEDKWERLGRKSDLVCTFLLDFDQKQEKMDTFIRGGLERSVTRNGMMAGASEYFLVAFHSIHPDNYTVRVHLCDRIYY